VIIPVTILYIMKYPVIRHGYSVAGLNSNPPYQNVVSGLISLICIISVEYTVRLYPLALKMTSNVTVILRQFFSKIVDVNPDDRILARIEIRTFLKDFCCNGILF
jgi:hypothetical protein